MPHVNNLIPKKHPMKLLFGQKSLTKFEDYRQSIKVELLNPEPKDQMMRRIYQFVKATWADSSDENSNPTIEQMEEALNAMLSGKSLQLGLEATNLTFKISGITRIDLQQIVRQRIGVVFSVQCSGDRDIRHNSILVEECIAQESDLLQSYIDSVLHAKNSYEKMTDSLKISIQAARSIIPESRELFMLMNTNLSTLLFFHQKRIEDGSQTWQINEIAQQMADSVCEVYPEMKEVFERNKSKFKFQKEASADRKNSFSTGLYIPKVDEFEYHNMDFLYPVKKVDMHFTGTPIKPMYFWGMQEVSEDQYNFIKNEYSKLNIEIRENHYSNEGILEKARALNSEILPQLQLTV